MVDYSEIPCCFNAELIWPGRCRREKCDEKETAPEVAPGPFRLREEW